jgi:hypothetical protein
MRFVLGSGFVEGGVSNANRHLIADLSEARELPSEVCCGHFCVVFVTMGGDVRELQGALFLASAEPFPHLCAVKPHQSANLD